MEAYRVFGSWIFLRPRVPFGVFGGILKVGSQFLWAGGSNRNAFERDQGLGERCVDRSGLNRFSLRKLIQPGCFIAYFLFYRGLNSSNRQQFLIEHEIEKMEDAMEGEVSTIRGW
jgi:hypothetical protein